MRFSKAEFYIFGAVVVAATLSVIVANASARHDPYRGAGIRPANIAALTSERTRVAGLPAPVAGLQLGDVSPSPGTVHALGAGALAWSKAGRVCFYQRLTAGCVDQVDKPINIVVADPDVVGGGAPLRASGVATDEVKSVAVLLEDGRTLAAAAVGNFYDIELPSDIGPSSSFTVEARLKDGTAYSERVGSR
jgi:hypothetical protein